MPDVTICCQTCNERFSARPTDLKRGHAKYCSRKCFGVAKSKLPKKLYKSNVSCALCKKAFYKSVNKQALSKSGLFFCCRKHKDMAQRLDGIKEIHPPHYNSGAHHAETYRAAAFRSHDKKCQSCGFEDVPEVLEVHHKDRDQSNLAAENLAVLCPTCHRVDHFHAGDGHWTKH